MHLINRTRGVIEDITQGAIMEDITEPATEVAERQVTICLFAGL